MRVFQYVLDKNIEEYIFSFLTPLDLALSRVVCKGWRDWIKSKKELNIRPSFKRNLLDGLPLQYDRDEYIYVIEKYTCYEKISSVPCRNISSLTLLMNIGAIHSILFCLRAFKFNGSKSACIWATCLTRPELWNSILLPRLSKREKKISMYFWDCLQANNVEMLKWMIERNLVDFSSTYMFADDGWWLNYGLDKRKKSLEFIRDNPRVPRQFIEYYMKKVWDDSRGKTFLGDEFLFMAQLFGFIPVEVCANSSHEGHDLFRHVCGCSLNGSSFSEPDFKHQKIKTN